ncbi:hypothetical protein CIT292_08880 [Citrobacter youngae ATCC 29220]|uniref:Uncharacterized protein n=1 Tax=Citrobacter youngae ATCC 29220 TaxID=500640 RepID=D4BEE7_9ENTR|nr:hypothetical protein CIT292_08880 [Citrobacter youngae ATCC 29220]
MGDSAHIFGNGPEPLKPCKKYGIDNHFQYHLINYNDPTAYAALTLAARQYWR